MHLKVAQKVVETMKSLEGMGYLPFYIDIEVVQLPRGISGVANLKHDRIRISTDFMAEHEEDVLARTVPHEVVHLYVNKYFKEAKQYHGKEFRTLMKLLGADHSTNHSMYLKNDVSKARLVDRFVYITDQSREIIHLTPGQHDKACRGAAYRYKGQKIIYDNQSVKV